MDIEPCLKRAGDAGRDVTQGRVPSAHDTILCALAEYGAMPTNALTEEVMRRRGGHPTRIRAVLRQMREAGKVVCIEERATVRGYETWVWVNVWTLPPRG